MSFRAKDVKLLLALADQDLVLHKSGDTGSYDPTTGSVTGGTSSDLPFKGYFFNQNLGNSGSSQVQSGNRQCFFAPIVGSSAPDTDDSISGSGDKVNITKVTSIMSKGVALAYICDVGE